MINGFRSAPNIHAERAFDEFVRADGQRLRRVMSFQYGVDIGCKSTDPAPAWAWEHRERLRAMSNPAGYLYRVAQTQARRAIGRGGAVVFPPQPTGGPDSGSSIAGDLADALRLFPTAKPTASLTRASTGCSSPRSTPTNTSSTPAEDSSDRSRSLDHTI